MVTIGIEKIEGVGHIHTHKNSRGIRLITRLPLTNSTIIQCKHVVSRYSLSLMQLFQLDKQYRLSFDRSFTITGLNGSLPNSDKQDESVLANNRCLGQIL